MHLTVYEQCRIFYFAFVFGLALGAFYDLFRLLRYLGFTARKEVIAQDIFFMCVSAILCFLFSQTVVNGHLRGFVMLGNICGFFAYRFSIGMLSGFVFSLIKKFLDLIFKLFKSLRLTITDFYGKILRFVEDKLSFLKKVNIN